MGSDNSKKFLSTSGDYVININHALKGIKSDVVIDFIRSDYRGLIIVFNKVTAPSDISIINKYVKNSNNLNVNDIQDARLPVQILFQDSGNSISHREYQHSNQLQ